MPDEPFLLDKEGITIITKTGEGRSFLFAIIRVRAHRTDIRKAALVSWQDPYNSRHRGIHIDIHLCAWVIRATGYRAPLLF